MATFRIFIMLSALFLTASLSYGADLDERLKALEEVSKQQQKVIEEQQRLIEGLKQDLNKLQAGEPQKSTETQVLELKEKVDQVAEAQTRTIPSVFNPAIGFVGEAVFSYRSKGASLTGSSRPGGFDAFARSVELNAAASVDPFAKAYIVANASADAATGEATFSIEEAALQTESLPGNLTVKAGRFFGEFGRLAYIHDHELPFVNRPLVLAQYIGGESRTDGVQLNWLVPIEHYVSLTVGAGNQFGGDVPPNNVGDFRRAGGLNYWGRLSSYVDITPDISLEPGVSGLWNPKTVDRGGSFTQPDGSTLSERERRLTGVDLTLSYKPLRDNQFTSIIWGTEVLYSHNRYDEVNSDGLAFSRDIGSYGLYSYLAYKFHRQWSAGFLYGFVEDAQDNTARTYEYSPFITWSLSHWNQLRLQYTYTNHNAVSGLRPDNAVYLQWAWIIGAHSHGWQQR
ncbi:MAG: hypothetical protein HQK99_03390 [Nitrospirae bacterium]|nr:hypothetical protein [Nitrospirota bacterium]